MLRGNRQTHEDIGSWGREDRSGGQKKGEGGGEHEGTGWLRWGKDREGE